MVEQQIEQSNTIAEIEPNLMRITTDSQEIILIGTAHVSRASAEHVERVIREIRPELVCLELCPPRLDSLRNPDRWRETNIVDVIRSGRLYVLMAQLALSAFQKRIATKFGIKPEDLNLDLGPVGKLV